MNFDRGEMSRCCEHGRLKRKCLICELQEELAASRKREAKQVILLKRASIVLHEVIIVCEASGYHSITREFAEEVYAEIKEALGEVGK